MPLQVELQRIGFAPNDFQVELQRVTFGGSGFFQVELQSVSFGGNSYSLTANDTTPESGEQVLLNYVGAPSGTVVWRVISSSNPGAETPLLIGSGSSATLILPAYETQSKVVIGAKQPGLPEQTVELTVGPVTEYYFTSATVRVPVVEFYIPA